MESSQYRGLRVLSSTVMTPLPKSLQARSDREAIRADIAPYLGMSIEERSQVVGQLCRWATAALDANPNRERAWAWQDKRSPESLALWTRLVAAARR